LLRKPDIIRNVAPRAAARRRLVRRLGLLAEIRARRDRRDPRLIVVILRGGLDGLATVAPIGDPDMPACMV